MAGATLAEIRAGLETRLATIPGVQTLAYMIDNPSPRTLWVMGPDRVEYDQAGSRGLDYWNMIVQGFSGSPLDIAAQVNLDDWLSPSGADSVKAAIEGDRTLGGIVNDCVVRETSGYRHYQVGPDNGAKVTYLGADWTVFILNSGT